MRKLIMMIMAVALIALPAMAQQQEWKSTSTMQTSGSTYSAQVTAVGAAEVTDMAKTTTNESSGPNRRRAKKDGENDWGDPVESGEGDDGSPIGDAVLPLLLLACAYLGFRAARKRA